MSWIKPEQGFEYVRINGEIFGPEECGSLNGGEHTIEALVALTIPRTR